MSRFCLYIQGSFIRVFPEVTRNCTPLSFLTPFLFYRASPSQVPFLLLCVCVHVERHARATGTMEGHYLLLLRQRLFYCLATVFSNVPFTLLDILWHKSNEEYFRIKGKVFIMDWLIQILLLFHQCPITDELIDIQHRTFWWCWKKMDTTKATVAGDSDW